MFFQPREILGRKDADQLENGWRIHRYDKRNNSASREWESWFDGSMTAGFRGCRKFEINLNRYCPRGEVVREINVIIGVLTTEEVAMIQGVITSANNMMHLYEMDYSPSFPDELIIRKISLESAGNVVGQLVDLINQSSVTANNKPLLPKDDIVAEAEFISTTVADSANAIMEQWTRRLTGGGGF